eukprot:766407-Hanusia_phi.AAC.4
MHVNDAERTSAVLRVRQCARAAAAAAVPAPALRPLLQRPGTDVQGEGGDQKVQGAAVVCSWRACLMTPLHIRSWRGQPRVQASLLWWIPSWVHGGPATRGEDRYADRMRQERNGGHADGV